jgi:hypothetical protein
MKPEEANILFTFSIVATSDFYAAIIFFQCLSYFLYKFNGAIISSMFFLFSGRTK